MPQNLPAILIAILRYWLLFTLLAGVPFLFFWHFFRKAQKKKYKEKLYD
jgi:hypothetical protein